MDFSFDLSNLIGFVLLSLLVLSFLTVVFIPLHFAYQQKQKLYDGKHKWTQKDKELYQKLSAMQWRMYFGNLEEFNFGLGRLNPLEAYVRDVVESRNYTFEQYKSPYRPSEYNSEQYKEYVKNCIGSPLFNYKTRMWRYFWSMETINSSELFGIKIEMFKNNVNSAILEKQERVSVAGHWYKEGTNLVTYHEPTYKDPITTFIEEQMWIQIEKYTQKYESALLEQKKADQNKKLAAYNNFSKIG